MLRVPSTRVVWTAGLPSVVVGAGAQGAGVQLVAKLFGNGAGHSNHGSGEQSTEEAFCVIKQVYSVHALYRIVEEKFGALASEANPWTSAFMFFDHELHPAG